MHSGIVYTVQKLNPEIDGCVTLGSVCGCLWAGGWCLERYLSWHKAPTCSWLHALCVRRGVDVRWVLSYSRVRDRSTAKALRFQHHAVFSLPQQKLFGLPCSGWEDFPYPIILIISLAAIGMLSTPWVAWLLPGICYRICQLLIIANKSFLRDEGTYKS